MMEQTQIAGATTNAQLIYEPFPDEGHFRLLKISSYGSRIADIVYVLQTFSLDDAPSYVALSYTWGSAIIKDAPNLDDASGPLESTINIEGKQVQITQNLFDFLLEWTRREGFPGSQFIWIDAICINQSDLSERSTQVQQMGRIFSLAGQVIVWLGRDTSDLDDFVWLHENLLPLFRQPLSPLGTVPLLERSPYDPEIREVLEVPSVSRWDAYINSYYRFCNRRRWFSRAWVAQEFALNSNILFLCGSTTLPTTADLGDMAFFFIESRWSHLVMKGSKHSNALLGNCFFPIFIAKESVTGMLNGDPVWTGLMDRFGGCETPISRWYCFLGIAIMGIRSCVATDARDKIYALLGVAGLSFPHEGFLPITSDYTKSVQEVYISTTAQLVCNIPSLLTLSMVEDKQRRKLTDLPSWTPDYTTTSSALLCWCGNWLYNASCGIEVNIEARKVSMNTLSLAGVCVDGIEHVSSPLIGILTHPRADKLLKFCLTLPYIDHRTRQPRDEVLWRTLIADFANGQHPAPPEFAICFHDFLTWLGGLQVLVDAREAHEHSLPVINLPSIKENGGVRQDGSQGSIPSDDEILEKYLELFELYAEISDLSIMATLTRHAKSGGTQYAKTLSDLLRYRALYRTKSGSLGLGPESMQKGDEVWILCGAKVPFILRPEEGESNQGTPGTEKVNRRFSLVGESYLHGIMQGEFFSDMADPNSLVTQIDII